MSSSLGIRVHDVGPRFARRGLWLGDQCCRLRASGYGELPKIQASERGPEQRELHDKQQLHGRADENFAAEGRPE